jgi:hypothetical protein
MHQDRREREPRRPRRKIAEALGGETQLTEREAFMAYVNAIGERVGHDATAEEARRACPEEFALWREAFTREVGYDPTENDR